METLIGRPVNSRTNTKIRTIVDSPVRKIISDRLSSLVVSVVLMGFLDINVSISNEATFRRIITSEVLRAGLNIHWETSVGRWLK